MRADSWAEGIKRADRRLIETETLRVAPQLVQVGRCLVLDRVLGHYALRKVAAALLVAVALWAVWFQLSNGRPRIASSAARLSHGLVPWFPDRWSRRRDAQSSQDARMVETRGRTHYERNHQGLSNQLLFPIAAAARRDLPIACRPRAGRHVEVLSPNRRIGDRTSVRPAHTNAADVAGALRFHCGLIDLCSRPRVMARPMLHRGPQSRGVRTASRPGSWDRPPSGCLDITGSLATPGGSTTATPRCSSRRASRMRLRSAWPRS